MADGPIDEWFGGGPEPYLVLPRGVLQSMPREWQDQFAGLLRDAGSRLGHHYGANDYRVRLVDADGRRADDPLAEFRGVRLGG